MRPAFVLDGWHGDPFQLKPQAEPGGGSGQEELKRDDKTSMDEFEVMDALQALLQGEALENTLLDDSSARSFTEAGIMSYNKGLVLRTADGSEFQITIVQSR